MSQREIITNEDWQALQGELPVSPLARANTFSEYLRIQRIEKGLTPKGLAEKSGISISTLRRFSRNPYHCLASTLYGVFDALELPQMEQNDVWEKFIRGKD